jgi:low affinity Fe/Cu permease
MNALFSKIAQYVSRLAGRPVTFMVAVALIVVWGLSGPLFGFSDTWQLIINTGTTICTFLMVFLLQNTQNRDTSALHVKLDELICVTKDARDELMDLESGTEEDILKAKQDVQSGAKHNRE